MRASIRIALAAWIALAAAVVALYGGSALDDFFITYRYAANFGAGDGFVFNPGERVFGLTEPAWGFLLALMHRATGLAVPWISSVLYAAALVGLAWLGVVDEIEPGRDPAGGRQLEKERGVAALVAGTLIVTLPLFWSCRGAGVVPGLALLALAVRLRERPVLAGALAAMAVGFRPELGLGVAAALLSDWFESRKFPWRFVAASAAVGAAGALACRLWFGTWLPITMGAKLAFATWEPIARTSGANFWPAFRPLLVRNWGTNWPIYFAIAALGVLVAFRSGGRIVRVLLATGIALGSLYPLLGVPLFGWYTIPTIVAALYGFAHLAVGLVRRLALAGTGRSFAPRIAAAALAVFFAALVAPSLRTLVTALAHPAPEPNIEVYRLTATYIAGESRPEATVAALEVGALSYYSGRRVVDLLGLVSPAALANVGERKVFDTLRAEPADWFVLTPGLERLAGPVRSLPWFAELYALDREIVGRDGQRIWIFRLRD